MFIKKFDEWNKSKQLTDTEKFVNFVNEREIWWCSLGVNIGSEQDGTGENFGRPIVIYKTLSPATCLILPLSTKKKMSKFQSLINHNNISNYALLDQARVIDKKRLRRKIGMVDLQEWVVLKEKFKEVIR